MAKSKISRGMVFCTLLVIISGCATFDQSLVDPTPAGNATIQQIVQYYRFTDKMELSRKIAERHAIDLQTITAFELALQHSQNVFPTNDEYNTVLNDLKTLAAMAPAKRNFHFFAMKISFRPESFDKVNFWKHAIEIPELDDLCNKYQLRSIRSPSPTYHSNPYEVELVFDGPRNMNLIAQEFAQFQNHVAKAETIPAYTYEIGDGGWIDMAGYALYRRYIVTEGWGDCPAGCINRKYVYYTADQNGNIVKTGEYIYDYPSRSGTPMWGIPSHH